MTKALKDTKGQTVAFGDVVKLSKERSKDPESDRIERYIGLEHIDPSDLKVRRWGDIADGTTFTSVFKPGQVLFGKRRAYQRKVAVADFSGVCSGDIYVLEPKNDHLLPELLPFICQSEPFHNYVVSMSQGGLSPRVNWKALANYELALPTMKEQRRIAAVLQAVDSTINCLISTKEQSDTLYQSTLDEFFVKDPESDDIVVSPNCQKKALSDVALIRFSNVDKKTSQNESAVSLCNYMDVYSNDYIDSDVDFMTASASASEVSKFSLEKGDVLVTKDSEAPDDIGVPAVVKTKLSNVLCGYHLALIRPNHDILHPNFMAHYFRSSVAKRYLYKMSEGVTRYGLTAASLQRMPVPLPTIEEQRDISCVMDSSRLASAACINRAEMYRAFQRNLLRQLLS